MEYEIIEEVARGAYGIIFLVRENHLNRYFIMKRISLEEAEARESFLREKNFLNRDGSRAFPILYDCYQEEGEGVLILERILGESLEQVIAQNGVMEEKEALRIGIQLTEILDEIHKQEQPMLYLDLKPENVILQKDGRVRLIDFGSVCQMRKKEGGSFGTPGYSAPEVWQGRMEDISIQSDVYSIGAVVSFLLTGISPCKPPYHAPRVYSLNRRVTPGTSFLLARCAHEKCGKRPRNMEELTKAFRKRGKVQGFGGKIWDFFCPKPYRIEILKSRMETAKKGVGLGIWGGILLGADLWGGIHSGNKPMMCAMDNRNRCVLIREGQEYEPEGDFHLCISQDNFKEGERYQVVVRVEGENLRREPKIFHLRYQKKSQP